jgi:hypothetical protein
MLPKNFVILFQEKEGSSAVVECLQCTPGMHVIGFEPFDRYRFLRQDVGGNGRDMPHNVMMRCFELIFNRKIPQEEAETELEQLYGLYNSSGVHAWMKNSVTAPERLELDREKSLGLKMRVRPTMLHNMMEMWKRLDVVVFVMYREDALKWALSKYKEGHLQFRMARGELESAPKIQVDMNHLRRVLSDCDRSLASKRDMVTTLRKRGIHAELLSYEHFCFNQRAWLEWMLKKLSIKPTPDTLSAALNAPTHLRKVHSDDLQEVVNNYQALERWIPERIQRSHQIAEKAKRNKTLEFLPIIPVPVPPKLTGTTNRNLAICNPAETQQCTKGTRHSSESVRPHEESDVECKDAKPRIVKVRSPAKSTPPPQTPPKNLPPKKNARYWARLRFRDAKPRPMSARRND